MPREYLNNFAARDRGEKTVPHDDADYVSIDVMCSRRFKNVVRHAAALEFPDRATPSMSSFMRLAAMCRVRDLTGSSPFEVMLMMQTDEPGWWHGAITRLEESRFYDLSQLTSKVTLDV